MMEMLEGYNTNKNDMQYNWIFPLKMTENTTCKQRNRITSSHLWTTKPSIMCERFSILNRLDCWRLLAAKNEENWWKVGVLVWESMHKSWAIFCFSRSQFIIHSNMVCQLLSLLQLKWLGSPLLPRNRLVIYPKVLKSKIKTASIHVNWLFQCYIVFESIWTIKHVNHLYQS